MSNESSGDQPGDAAERFRLQMERDARSWSADQMAASDRREDVAAELAASQARAAKAAEKQRAKAKAAAAAKPQPATPRKGPFSMGYGGLSNADYIASRAARGAR